MFDFSGDEALFLLFSAAMTVGGLFALYAPLLTIPLLGRSSARRLALRVLPLLLLIFTGFVLHRSADPQVARHADYMLLFLLGNTTWLTAVAALLPLAGISIRLDAIDRDNPAAAAIACGALSGASISYALANVAGGPTIWTTVAPAFVATAAWGVIWIMIECIGGDVAEAITIGRDTACGIRSGGVLLANGIILGRAAGGAWISWDQTWSDLASFGWPTVALGLVAAIIQRNCLPTVSHPTRDVLRNGWLWAVGFVLIAMSLVLLTPHGRHPSQW